MIICIQVNIQRKRKKSSRGSRVQCFKNPTIALRQVILPQGTNKDLSFFLCIRS